MKPKAIRKRLDILLVERGIAGSLKEALAMILAGEVQIDGKRTDKAGTPIAADARIELTNRAQQFVSRGGVKLKGALADFAIDPKGCICLDIGSSTGGFTDCLLQQGASRVYAVDVNTEEIDWKLRQDPRVVRIERNARELDGEELAQKAAVVVIDVSFISVSKVLGPAISEAEENADFLILIKPQFELSREEVAPGGIVTDTDLHQKAILKIRKAAESFDFEVFGVHPSHLLGAEGNQEYFLHARKKSLE